MAIEFLPLTEELSEACAAFNSRMRAVQAPVDFYLPESVTDGLRQVVALDDDRVCGGYIEALYPGCVAAEELVLVNIQSPLSEGLINSKYLTLAAQMVTHCVRRNPYAFVVGMGSVQNRFAKILKSVGWSVEEIPFFFRMCRPTSVLRELTILRRPRWRDRGARLAAATRLGPLAIHAAQGARGAVYRPGPEWEVTMARGWGSWADSLWAVIRPTLSLAVRRDAETLACLYPDNAPQLRRYLITRRAQPRAWVVGWVSRMTNHHHFGNLTVATLLDAGAAPGAHRAAFSLATRALAAEDVDLVVANFSHSSCASALRENGFWEGPSNYLLATSPALVRACGSPPVMTGQAHFTRGDGDGRSNL